MSRKTSWQPVHKWYSEHQQEDGGYYHRELIIPKLLSMLHLTAKSKVLDLGCGEGILSRSLPKTCKYVGLDASKGLIDSANKKKICDKHKFIHGDITRYTFDESNFTHALFVLSLQNIFSLSKALENTEKALAKSGELILVLNHPCFRIPKYSSWHHDYTNHKQTRSLERYKSSFKAPIQAHPSKKQQSAQTVSFHFSLETLFQKLQENHFCVVELFELCSNKKSYGKNAKSENFARKEFPLFLIVKCKKRAGALSTSNQG